jgi:hypothetical protein
LDLVLLCLFFVTSGALTLYKGGFGTDFKRTFQLK